MVGLALNSEQINTKEEFRLTVKTWIHPFRSFALVWFGLDTPLGANRPNFDVNKVNITQEINEFKILDGLLTRYFLYLGHMALNTAPSSPLNLMENLHMTTGYDQFFWPPSQSKHYPIFQTSTVKYFFSGKWCCFICKQWHGYIHHSMQMITWQGDMWAMHDGRQRLACCL